MTLRSAIAIVMIAAVPLCTTEAAAQQATAPTIAADASYQVGPGDILTVTVYRAPDYNGIVEVAEDGTIVLNAIGRVKAAGMTPARVGNEIARRLQSGGIFRDPLVNVLVQTYRSSTVSVLGAVAKPGEYPLDRGGMTITEILARAGATLGVGGGTVRLLHKDGTQQDLAADQVLAGSTNERLQPHDTLIVTESATFYVSGEVQRPGSYPLEPGLTMERAIALAGGVTLRGARSRLKVTRHAGAVDEMLRAKPQDPVKPRDLITVGARLF
jgi:polysaccharide export outer membrane protein